MRRPVIRATYRDLRGGTWRIPWGWRLAWPHPLKLRWVVLPTVIIPFARYGRAVIVSMQVWASARIK